MLSSTYIDSCSADHRPDETSLLGIQLLLSLATTFAATIRLTMRRADPRLPVEVSLCAHQSQAGSRLRSGRTCGRVPAPPPIAHGIALNSPNAALSAGLMHRIETGGFGTLRRGRVCSCWSPGRGRGDLHPSCTRPTSSETVMKLSS